MVKIKAKYVGNSEVENEVHIDGIGNEIYKESVSAVRSLLYSLRCNNEELAMEFMDTCVDHFVDTLVEMAKKHNETKTS